VRPNVLPSTIGVGLTVTAGKPPAIVSFNQAAFLNWNGRIYFSPTNYTIPSSIIPGAFNITVTTEGGGNWLVATSNGTTPASVAVSAVPVNASPGTYAGRVIVSGSGNTFVINAQYGVYGTTMLSCDDIQLSAQAGAAPSPPRSATVTTYCDIAAEPCPSPPLSPSTLTASVSTSSGGGWLHATVAGDSISVSANSTGLPAGLYFGVIDLSSNNAAPAQVLVSLLVWSGPVPLLVASPLTLSLSDSSAQSTQTCASSSENIPLDLTTQTSTSDGGNWLSIAYSSATTPSCPGVTATTTGLLPGTYHGSIVFTGGGQSVTVPVSLTVSPPADQPLLGTIVNAASGISGSIAPGEIVTVHGLGLGTTTPASLTIDAQGQLATRLSETSLLIGGIAAPLLYVSQSQINAIVPYEIAGQQMVTVQAQSGGVSSPIWGVPVAGAVPGIFTTDSSGQGPGAILNQDNSVNAPSNPAAVGSVIQIYATGEGQTNPPGKTGSIASGENSPVLPVSVSIGGINAPVSYAGTAPSSVEGLFQINAIVPLGATPGAALPVRIIVGSTGSQLGVTIAVR
jgi:uncharacterized protein (TIGR03437 family)